LSGLVTELRVINGQRGKLGLFKLDDKSGTIEARADEALLNAHKNLLKDDELIIAMGKVQPDRFSGGLQFTVQQLWSLEAARCRFGKYLHIVAQNRQPDIAKVLQEFPAQQEIAEQGTFMRGLAVRLQLEVASEQHLDICNGAQAVLALGEDAQFFPSDAALAAWQAQAEPGTAEIIYD
jgi:DNA polymerase-3 subunit alpha